MSTRMKFYKPEPRHGLLNVKTVNIYTRGISAEIRTGETFNRRNWSRARAMEIMARDGYFPKASIPPRMLKTFVRVVQ